MIDFSNTLRHGRHRLLMSLAALLVGGTALASPGAHGPNGEHLDGPAQTTAGASSAPRMEAKSESFELVGYLRGDEFSMLVNRFETNEPVLNAKVEVETGALKAPAKFHADMGDYAVDDAAFLKALKAPGTHAIVVTIIAGAESDLLDGTLKSEGADADAGTHSHDDGDGHGLPLTAWLAIALAAIGALIYALSRRSARSAAARNGGAR
ncbi:hypothetical protein [Variovorax sp. W2I14]|uniref:hypothetical protein n=1 Tax=Variovorax sp. W2I14 TaxID=3042290 RepID=UPI003D227D1D